MIGFLFGLAIGLFVSAVGLVSLLSAYPRGEDVYVTEFYNGLGYLILAMAALAVVAGVVGMVKQIGADRRRDRLPPIAERDSLL